MSAIHQLPQSRVVINRDKLTRDLCRASFYDFVRQFWDIIITEPPVWNWHIKFLCDELQKVAERVFNNKPKAYDLIVNVPPGSTKSTIASVMYTPWIWTRMLHARTINGSYAHPLAVDLSRKARDIVQSERYQKLFPEVVLREDQNTKSEFSTTKHGTRFSVGIGGSITGKHGHFIIIDDPLNPKQALSAADVLAANNWMTETLPSRKVDKAVTPTILIMQRLAQNDPTGERLEREKKGGGKVRHVCLPAEDSSDVKPERCRKYYRDGLLDPVRLSKGVLEDLKIELGEFGYAGQFSQRPVPRGGGMFKIDRLNFNPAPSLRYFTRLVRFWDKAGTKEEKNGSKGKGSAYTVGVLMGRYKDGTFWVLDVVRFRAESFEREKRIKDIADMDGKQVTIGLEQEPGSGGKDSALGTVRNLAGYRVRVELPTGDKAARADPYSVQVNAGNVYVAMGEWNRAYIDELEYFPFSTYKDQVDASSGAFNLLTKPVPFVGAVR